MIIKEINVDFKPFEIFLKFKSKDYLVFLDSCKNYEKLGEYSIITFDPFLKIKSKNGKVYIDSNKKNINVFELLNKEYNKYKQSYKTDLPFIGGIVGHFSYDLCHEIEDLPKSAKDDIKLEDINLGFYHGAIVFDHKKRKVFLTDANIDGKGNKRIEKIKKNISDENKDDFKVKKSPKNPNLKANMTKDEYLESIKKIKDYIKNGDIYQVNMTQRFETDLTQDPINLYAKLRKINPAPFAAYMDFNNYQVLSSSPERFIKLKENILETRPIKGTRPRGENKKEDELLKNELRNSKKDRSELLMIVDLERNDFSKVAKTSTVDVKELFAIEKYPTVFHLVSTIQCELDKEYNCVDVLKACFPGGSITGAPKIRAMEIIDELEPTTRNLYTGSIGYIDFNGDMDLNIVIRTMLVKDKKVYFQVGGGIVWDSNPYDEYQESLDKAKALIEALSV